MKILMFTLLSACDLSFWHMLLGMLLPFLLGLLLGWFLWARYKSMVAELQSQIVTANKRIDTLESEVASVNSRNKTLSSELSLSRNAQSKLESDLSTAKNTHNAFATKAGVWEKDLIKGKEELAKCISRASSLEKDNSALKSDVEQAKKRIKDLENKVQNALKATGGIGASALGTKGVAGLTGTVSDKKDEDEPKIETAHRDYDDVQSDKPTGLKTGALGGAKIGAQGIAPVGGDVSKDKKEVDEPKIESAHRDYDDVQSDKPSGLKTGALGGVKAGSRGIAPVGGDVSNDKKEEGDPKVNKAHRDYDEEAGKKDAPSGLKTGALGGVKAGSRGIAPVGGGDDLTKVEGIGPKIAGLFNDDGIYSWLQLSEKDPKDLKIILDTAGSRYQMHDPGTWPKQAKMLSIGDMEKLNAYQDYLIGGRDPKSIVKDLADKMPDLAAGAKVFGQKIEMDDLKLIEGIGPAIESLLHNNDIKTWASLATSKVIRLQEILDTEGMRFKTAVPNTWPKQATLAYSGKWPQLKKLQDRLDGGKG